MLIKAETLRNYTLKNEEGGIGLVSELYFDDDWTIRYLAAETRKWLSCKRVLIPTDSLTGVIDTKKNIETGLTNQQIDEKPSPEILRRKADGEHGRRTRADGRPVPFYRGGILSWRTPTSRDQRIELSSSPAGRVRSSDAAHVTGIQEVTGFELHAADGKIGDIKDFIIDDETWKIRSLIVEPRYWWLGSKLNVTPEWIRQVSWSAGRLSLTLPRTTVQVSPAPRGGLAYHS